MTASKNWSAVVDRDPYIQAENDNRSAQVIQIDSGKHVAVVALCAALCAGSMVYAMLANTKAEEAKMESRMLQYYVLEMDAKLIAAGFKTDAESVAKKLKEN